ncbi:unnamed protein product [Brassicogethes aeneus]|uniref:Cytochrome c oxidase subunit n=1 Tax=Brassicogethes aeneus TaxID=1431903 RepID=A0A9P0FIK1_BRAAE|nr:unnamed protein product [Brassicogethes aeneus]
MSDQKNFQVRTALPDARYRYQNCTRWCYITFLDFHRCTRLLGEGNPACEEFAKIYKSICPNSWVSKWEDQMADGTFPVDLPEKEEDCNK